MKTIVQEYNVDVKGIGTFSVISGDSEILIPTFGFDNDGNAKSRRIAEKEGYAPLKREWIDNNIKLAVESYISQYKEVFKKGKFYDKDPFDYEITKDDDKLDCNTVYVFVFSRSDCPNEIGIATNDVPFKVVDSSFSFKESKIV